METDTETEDDADNVIDKKSVDAEIANGVKAWTELRKAAGKDWNLWSIYTRGFRALRGLAFANAHVSDIHSDAYRKEIGRLLKLAKYSAYSEPNLAKTTRSAMYKMMDCIEEIDSWYAGLPSDDKLRWKHPETVIKYCPKTLLAGGMKHHNKPPKPGKKKTGVDAEVARLRGLLTQAATILMDTNPGEAKKLLNQIHPADDPSDEIPEL